MNHHIIKMARICIICLSIGAVAGIGIYYAASAPKIAQTIAERDSLLDQYRIISAETSKMNQALINRNRKLEEGIGGLKELTSGSIKDIQSAANILAGVKSILGTMEEYGDIWHSTPAIYQQLP